VAVEVKPIDFWLTDRSRWKRTLSSCARARYLGCHYGPTGYGITIRGESLPLVTGQHVHRGLELALTILHREDRLPTVEEQREIVAEVCTAYEARCVERGFRGMLASPQVDETILEQKSLIAGLLWVLRVKFLPWFHETYRVVEIEQERLHLLSCTCGLPLSVPADVHRAKGCAGRALMIRTDLLAQRRTGRGLAYFETKTTGWDSEAWAEQWETDPQLALGTLDLPERYGQEVTELYILSLAKGARRRDTYEETAGASIFDEGTGAGGPPPRPPKRQVSPLCYGYCRPANPPLQPEDWLPAYKWTDPSTGLEKRASRAHKRKGLWLLEESDWPTWRAYAAQDQGLTAIEYWVRAVLPPSLVDKIASLIGPMNRQDHQIASVMRSMDTTEAAAQGALWELYELQQKYPWASDEVQACLDRDFPQSWDCRRFGRDHQCEFVAICHHETGWQEPLLGGRYVPRLPHHQPEREQAIGRGLLAAEAVEEEGE
jgi:hypothetical protein